MHMAFPFLLQFRRACLRASKACRIYFGCPPLRVILRVFIEVSKHSLPSFLKAVHAEFLHEVLHGVAVGDAAADVGVVEQN